MKNDAVYLHHIHAYFRVDLFIVWDTAQSDLPHLKHQIEQLLEEMGENDCKV